MRYIPDICSIPSLRILGLFGKILQAFGPLRFHFSPVPTKTIFYSSDSPANHTETTCTVFSAELDKRIIRSCSPKIGYSKFRADDGRLFGKKLPFEWKQASNDLTLDQIYCVHRRNFVGEQQKIEELFVECFLALKTAFSAYLGHQKCKDKGDEAWRFLFDYFLNCLELLQQSIKHSFFALRNKPVASLQNRPFSFDDGILPFSLRQCSFDDYPILGFLNSQKTCNPGLILSHPWPKRAPYCLTKPFPLKNTIQSSINRKKRASRFIILSEEKQKQEILMNYSIDIQHNDQNNRHTSDSEHSNHYLLDKAMEKLAKAQKNSRVKMSSFSWSKTEEKKYISFLRTNSKLFHLSPKQRKEIKINVMMSYAIKTRTSAQCHSHHQKMILKYDDIQNIINQHLYLFDKEIKSQVKTWLPLAAQSREIQAPIQEEIMVEQESKAEPLWWRYLDLMDEHQDSLWQNSYSFSQ